MVQRENDSSIPTTAIDVQPQETNMHKNTEDTAIRTNPFDRRDLLDSPFCCLCNCVRTVYYKIHGCCAICCVANILFCCGDDN
ncbi:hypothetical protein K502DRAFT_325462 [Neoconidiobolus thromboides FSU 785]|nr:hypothetical protein K502DRAFT_325462 [Neoconidiobolus thromboides FSU 785]